MSNIKHLKTCYNTDEKQNKIKTVCMNLLKTFDNVCKMYSLQYWIDGGTLLGAARNGQMIPWDDDIDVVMPRDDYDKLCVMTQTDDKLFNDYVFQTSSTDTFFEVHAKLRNSNTCALTEREYAGTHNRGMFLDIFPLDNCPEDINIKKDIAGFVRTIAKHTGQDKNFKRSGSFYILNKVLRDVGIQHEDSNDIANMAFWRYDKKLITLKKKWYEQTILLHFEDLLVPSPIGFKNVLHKWYGTSWETPMQMPNSHKAYIDPFTPYKRYNSCTKEDFEYLIK